MKKERSFAGMVMMELAVGAGELLLIGAAVFGVVYAIGLVAELFDGIVSAGTAVWVLCAIAGVLLLHEFRPSEAKKPDDAGICGASHHRSVRKRRAIRAYSAR